MGKYLEKKLNIDQSLEKFDETEEEKLIEVHLATWNFIHGGEIYTCQDTEGKKNPFGDVKMKMLDMGKRH